MTDDAIARPRIAEVLASQLRGVTGLIHDVADDLSIGEWRARPLQATNLVGWDVWHTARCLDWTVNRIVRDGREVVDRTAWRALRGPLPGDGFGSTREQADDVALRVEPAMVLAYADALESDATAWLRAVDDTALAAPIDLAARLGDWPVELLMALRAFAPGLFTRLPAWQYITSLAIGHNRDHLAEIDLVKRHARAGTLQDSAARQAANAHPRPAALAEPSWFSPIKQRNTSHPSA
jgi:hypothetical protein